MKLRRISKRRSDLCKYASARGMFIGRRAESTALVLGTQGSSFLATFRVREARRSDHGVQQVTRNRRGTKKNGCQFFFLPFLFLSPLRLFFFFLCQSICVNREYTTREHFLRFMFRLRKEWQKKQGTATRERTSREGQLRPHVTHLVLFSFLIAHPCPCDDQEVSSPPCRPAATPHHLPPLTRHCRL